MKIVIAGGTGLCGRLLTEYFAARGDEISVLSRRQTNQTGVTTLLWDGKTLGDWASAIDGADVVINLAGRSVNCRYNDANKAQIFASRFDSTRAIGEAIESAANPPRVWLNAASATIYRHSLDRAMTEKAGEIGTGFSVDVCRRWEETLLGAHVPMVTRRVALRSAIVFSHLPGGVWQPFAWLARFGIAGPMAGGRSMVSWIHGEDFCRAVEWIIEHEEMSGPINLASPNPLANRDFLAAVRKAVGVPFGIPSARWMLECAAFIHRTETELLLKSRWVIPCKLRSSGFRFQHPFWPAAAKSVADAERISKSALPRCRTTYRVRCRLVDSVSALQEARRVRTTQI